MDPDRLKALLQAVEARQTSVDEAMRELRELPFRATGFAAMGFAHADTHRHLRTGFPEVVLGQGKTPEQIAAILIELRRGGSTVMASRVSPEAARGRRGGGARGALPAGAARRGRRADAGARSRARPDRRAQRRHRRRAGRRGGGADRRAGRQPRRADLRRRRRRPASPAGLSRAARDAPRSSSSSPGWRARCPAWSAGCSRGR